MEHNPLARSPLFAVFAPGDISALLRRAGERAMRAGETLVRRGDAGSAMMAVLAGEVRVELPDARGEAQVLRVLKAGEVFGELSLFDGKPRSADVVAVTQGRLLVIERAAVLGLMQDDPDFALRVAAVLCERLRATTAQLESLRFQDAGQRICAYLLQCQLEAGRNRIDITQAALAQIIGATRETVNRKLSEFELSGILLRRPGRITLLDLGRLRAQLGSA